MKNMIKPQKKILMKQRYIIYLAEFKVIVRKMLTSIGRSMDEHSENLNRERKYKVPNRSHGAKEYNRGTENSRLDE